MNTRSNSEFPATKQHATGDIYNMATCKLYFYTINGLNWLLCMINEEVIRERKSLNS